VEFPSNPTDGMIFESYPGVFYQYDATTNSWYRTIAPDIPLATPSRDGLMSSTDFTKLMGLIVPPPSTTLTFQGCSEAIGEGILSLQGDDDGIININVGDNIHENTAPVEFKVDVEKLAQKLQTLGRLRIVARCSAGWSTRSGREGRPACAVAGYVS